MPLPVIIEPGCAGRGNFRGGIVVPSPLGVAGSWRLTFRDEFDGATNAPPDLTRWDYWHRDESRDGAMLRAENTYLDGSSHLVMRLTNADIGYGAELSSGGLIEKNSAFSPGSYWEARMAHDGWSAFWSGGGVGGMNGLNTPPDPADGAETDISEYRFDFGLQQAVHYGGYDANHHFDTHAIGGVTLGAMNVYGMHWDLAGGSYKFYVNGALSWTYSTIVSTRTDAELILSQLNPGDGSTSALALVDYVRVWMPG